MNLRFVAVGIALLLSIFRADGAQTPLTARDVSLMLRTGYPSEAVIHDLEKRHFLDTIDQANESMLVKAGASLELIAALKSGTYAVPAEEAERAKAEMETQAKRRAFETEQSRKLDTFYQDHLARQRKAVAANPGAADAMSKFLKGALVRSQNGSVVPADDEAFANKKLIGLYFSAQWCGPCRKFTPKLVEYYNRVSNQHPEFEIVFFSLDKSASAMESYMREDKMPWPAIDYAKLQEKEALKKNSGGDGIPSLVVVDATGRVISSSYVDGKFLGPQKVLADLDTIFAGGKIAQVQ